MGETVSILVITHNRADVLRDTLGSLSKVRLPADVTFEVVLVTNACTDHTADVVEWAIKSMPMRVVHAEETRLGEAFARNRSVEASSGDILASIDDDVYLPEDWAETLLTAFRDLGADMIGGRVELAWEGPRPAWYMDGYLWLLSGCNKGDKTYLLKDPSGTIGANFAFRRHVPEKIGRFREDLGRIGRRLLAGTETEFITRAIQAGFKVYHVPANKVFHRVPPHRATADYVAAAMEGWATSNARYGPKRGPAGYLRTLVGNLSIWPLYRVRQALASMRGDELMKVSHRVKAGCAKGTALGAIHYLFSGPSPVESVPKSAVQSKGVSS